MKNRTFRNIRTVGLVLLGLVGFALFTHVVARLLWHFQLFGLNRFLTPCPTALGDALQSICPDPTDFAPTDFWQYTSDRHWVLESHGIAIALMSLIIGVVMIVLLIKLLRGKL